MTHRTPSSRSSNNNDTPPISPALDPYTHSDPYDHPTATYLHNHFQEHQAALPRLSITSNMIPKMSLECFLSASSETDFQSILTMELEEMRNAECLSAVCLYGEGGDAVAVEGVSGFIRAGKLGSLVRKDAGKQLLVLSDESLLGDDSPRTVVMDEELELHESIMDPESNSLVMRRESAVGILESMQFSAMDELLRHGDNTSKQHLRGTTRLATVADSKELRLLESFHSKETNIDDVICLLEGKSVPASVNNEERNWLDSVWPSSSVSVAFCVGAVTGMAVSSLLALRRKRVWGTTANIMTGATVYSYPERKFTETNEDLHITQFLSQKNGNLARAVQPDPLHHSRSIYPPEPIDDRILLMQCNESLGKDFGHNESGRRKPPQIISVGLAYVRFLILVKKQKVSVPWAIRFIFLAVVLPLVVIAVPVGVFNKDNASLLILRPSDAFCTLDWRVRSLEQLVFMVPAELLYITALFWIPYGYTRICNVVTATFSQLDLSQSHVIQTNESGVFQPELSRRESIHYASGRYPVRRRSMLGNEPLVVNAFGVRTKENIPSLQRRRSISNAACTGRPSLDRRRRMSVQISATVQLPEVKEMKEAGGGTAAAAASLKRNSPLIASTPLRVAQIDFSGSKDSIDKANASQKSLQPLHVERSHQTISKSRELQGPAETTQDQHRETESQSVCAQETTFQAERGAAKSFKSLNLSMASVENSFTPSNFQEKSLASIAQEVSFSESSSILPPVPAQVASPVASIAGFSSPDPSIARISLNASPKTNNTRERPRKPSFDRVKSFASQKPSFLTDRKVEVGVNENANRQKVVWTQSILIVLAYVLGWTPYFVLLVYEAGTGTAAPPEFDFVSMFMVVVWGAVNPVLVWLFDPEIRSTVSKSVKAVLVVGRMQRRNAGDKRREKEIG
ncbi:hypothetical protein HDU81_010386 [Chytriomyces hyalinus]|nr:hypothetical protein HDU81_010386 [Chytriomyces hyalinus]